MATIEVRKSCSRTSYRARVRVKGYRQITASFARKTDAKRWAAGIEADIHSGRYFPETHHTLSDAIKRYSDQHLPQLKDAAKRLQHLAWWDDQIGHMRLSDVKSDTISKCRSVLQTQPSTFGRHQGRLSPPQLGIIDIPSNFVILCLSIGYQCSRCPDIYYISRLRLFSAP